MDNPFTYQMGECLAFPSGSLKAFGRDSPVTLGRFLPRVTNFRVNFGGNICLGVVDKLDPLFEVSVGLRLALGATVVVHWLICALHQQATSKHAGA